MEPEEIEGLVEGTEANVEPVETPVPEGTQPVETPPVEEAIVEYGGQQFTASQIQEALHIQQNQADFTTKNQQEAERLNILQGVIEQARQGLTNRPVDTPYVQPSQQGNTPQFTAEQFRDGLLGDNPQEAIAQMVNLINETVTTQTSQNEAKSAFMTAHPDYLQIVSSPEYQTFKASSPLGAYLNDVNGYYEYKSSITGDATKAATAEAVKLGEKQALANATAKNNLKILNSGGGVTVPVKTAITPDTSQGDITNAAVQHLMAGRSG